MQFDFILSVSQYSFECQWTDVVHCCSFNHVSPWKHLREYTNGLQYWFLFLSAVICTFNQTVPQLIQCDFVSLSVECKRKSILASKSIIFRPLFWYCLRKHFAIESFERLLFSCFGYYHINTQEIKYTYRNILHHSISMNCFKIRLKTYFGVSIQ